MSNFGYSDLRLVRPYDPSFREAKSAVGASAVLAGAREYPTVAEAVADCNLVIGTTAAARREVQHPLRHLGENATVALVRKGLGRGRVALLFGSEKRGLSNEDFSHCHWLLRIPTREEHGSMNLGQAVAVCLYELACSRRTSFPRGRKLERETAKPATSVELERLTTLLLESLKESGYLDREPSVTADDKVRRMVRRLGLSTTDAATLLGMLRQMVWKMKRIG